MQNNDKCQKSLIRLLSALNKHDNRTVYGSNIFNIAKECQVSMERIDPITVKNNLVYFKIPSEEEWRIDLMHNLIQVKNGEFTVENFEDEELDNLLAFVCTS